MSCIYVLKNKINNKCYVGQTTKAFKWRLDRHISASKKNEYKICRAIRKYGIDEFKKLVFYVPDFCLDDLEIGMIKALNSVQFGYNCDGGGNKKKHRSEETKRKISESVKGKNHRCYGRHLPKETRRKISEANKGKHDYLKGRVLSVETKEKMSVAKKKWYANLRAI